MKKRIMALIISVLVLLNNLGIVFANSETSYEINYSGGAYTVSGSTYSIAESGDDLHSYIGTNDELFIKCEDKAIDIYSVIITNTV